ncbi:F0F1 ATP synthase subunit B [Anaerophilus nitritogenes]|uniref:F0F1 ATP synthase subunit B n=1 Tax=Anaerophilus nitritogenes TaxID=2498136 RepID=UPI00101C768D|nr:F0F1 ATP synthase subunit B [Anaerophilus nitritogenes]
MMGLVSVQGWTLVMNLVNVFILYIVLKKILFKPVKEFMDNRQNNITQSIEEAQRKNKQADAIKLEYEQRLLALEQEGREIIKDASKKAEDRANHIVDEAKEEAQRMIKRAQEEIKKENEKATHTLKDEMTSLIMMAASKIIDKELKEEDHQKLIQEFIHEVGDAKWQN